jgi:hypothetical protein
MVAAELVLNEFAASGREIVARVEVGIAQEIEHISVKPIGSGFRNDVNLASCIPPILPRRSCQREFEILRLNRGSV